jgi:Flp pilus assembly protein TadB
MPLDDAERSVLAATERALAHDDPDLDRRLRRAWGRRRSRARTAIMAGALLLIVCLCWLGLPGQAVLVLVLALAVLLATGWRPRDWVPVALRDH